MRVIRAGKKALEFSREFFYPANHSWNFFTLLGRHVYSTFVVSTEIISTAEISKCWILIYRYRLRKLKKFQKKKLCVYRIWWIFVRYTLQMLVAKLFRCARFTDLQIVWNHGARLSTANWLIFPFFGFFIKNWLRKQTTPVDFF